MVTVASHKDALIEIHKLHKLLFKSSKKIRFYIKKRTYYGSFLVY